MAKKKSKKKSKAKLRQKTRKKAKLPAKRKAVKRTVSRKPKARAAIKKPAAIIIKAPEKQLIGKVVHFYNQISVAVVEITDNELRIGDKISIEGPHTNVKQSVASMQIEREPIQTAAVGQSIGMKVSGRVREKDNVYKILA